MGTAPEFLISSYGLAGIVIIALASAVVVLWKYSDKKTEESRKREDGLHHRIELLTERSLETMSTLTQEIKIMNKELSEGQAMYHQLFAQLEKQTQAQIDVAVALQQIRRGDLSP